MKPIPGFPGYQITRDGRVWSEPRKGSGCSIQGRWLKLQLKSHGYYKVMLGKKGKRYSLYVHTLVLETYKSPRPKGMECRHLNGNPKDNHIENLEWGTRQENSKDTVIHGRNKIPHYKGVRNPASKLTEYDVRMIIYMYRTGEFTQKEIAGVYKVSNGTISAIVRRKIWRHLWAA